MGPIRRGFATLAGVFAALLLLHLPLLRLPYFWDEAGYYIPAALDFYHSGLLVPHSTLPTGHTPLVMVYLAAAWHVFGYSPLITRTAMLLVAAGTVASLYALGRRLASREVAAWSAALLALMPLFFAQSSLAHLDLAAALFTTLSVLFLVDEKPWSFALAATLAILSKETAVALLPVAWVYAWRNRGAHRRALLNWVAWALPLLPLAAWALYYHHATGYWTGNREYLAYNLYSTLNPARIFFSLLRRLYEVLIGGFDWLLTAGAILGAWWGRRQPATLEIKGTTARNDSPLRNNSRAGAAVRPDQFLWFAAGLGAIYVLMLSAVGGAILPRYLLPAFPVLILGAVMLLWRLPRGLARTLCLATAAGFLGGWFLNPPYPFPFEDNLAYTDFVRLHQDAAKFLEAQPGRPRVLTAWPATDELTRPFLGYVDRPLEVVPAGGFVADDFQGIRPETFDLVYLYSRQWNPANNWMARFPAWQKLQARHFDYRPQAPDDALATRYHLRLLRQFERRGQWVRLYAKSP